MEFYKGVNDPEWKLQKPCILSRLDFGRIPKSTLQAPPPLIRGPLIKRPHEQSLSWTSKVKQKPIASKSCPNGHCFTYFWCPGTTNNVPYTLHYVLVGGPLFYIFWGSRMQHPIVRASTSPTWSCDCGWRRRRGGSFGRRTQRVHVGTWYILKPQKGYYIMTLGPNGTWTLWVSWGQSILWGQPLVSGVLRIRALPSTHMKDSEFLYRELLLHGFGQDFRGLGPLGLQQGLLFSLFKGGVKVSSDIVFWYSSYGWHADFNDSTIARGKHRVYTG